MPCDAFFLNLVFLGGGHIITFGHPSSFRIWDRPAAIRDSSRSSAVGSKNMASSPTSQGMGYLNLSINLRINHFNQPAELYFNRLGEIFLTFQCSKIVIGNVQSGQNHYI